MRSLARPGLLPLALVFPLCFVLARAGRSPSDDSRARLRTDRASTVVLPLPAEEDAFLFAVFGDRTGGPAEGIRILEQAVADVRLVAPDLVMTVGDLVEGYNETPQWLAQMREYKSVMERLDLPWFPVAGNHDIYWRGPQGQKPLGEHESSYEEHFGPLWYAFRHKNCWFVALYSDEGDPQTGLKSFNDPSAQRMSPAQLAFLERTLAEARGADHVFVFLHHPRWLAENYGDDWERVHALLAAAGNVTAVFAGHIHRMRYDGVRDGIEYFTLATVGGSQTAVVPQAGYLHHYFLVTVRKGRIAVASYPVGTVADPRRITGEVSDDARAVAEALRPRFERRAALRPDSSVDGRFEFALANPGRRPLELSLVPRSSDSRWRFEPDHLHRVLEPGSIATFELRVLRGAHGLDESFREPELALRADYLAEGLRVAIPERAQELPLDLEQLAPAARPARESVLALDGLRAAASVESAALALPDGPFTIEGWLRAEEFRERQGFITKTENSEFGLFVSRGRADFLVHLGGRYLTASSAEEALEPGRWHHLAGVFDGAELRVYVDGARAGSRKGSGRRRTNELALHFGADVRGDGSGESFCPCELDELRVSSIARYDGERFEPARRHEPDEHTLLLYAMDAELGPWLYDSSPRRAHARRLGGAQVRAAR